MNQNIPMHAKRHANLGVKAPALTFADDFAEPANQHENDDRKTGQHDPEAGIATI